MPYDSANTYQNSITFSLGAGPFNDLGGSTLQIYTGGVTQRYVSGVTNRLFLTPASGGTTINGFDATGCSDGFTMLIVNNSTTDNLTFTHLGGGNANNQFFNVSSSSIALLPGGAAPCTYVVNKWRFA